MMRYVFVKHTNGIPKHINIEPYYGKVLSDITDPLQRVSLSLCNKRGIRGEISAFNETLIIKPSKYYLDIEYDEHLVWNVPSTTSIQSIANTIQNKNKRRRMAYNNDYSQTKCYRETYGNSW